MIHKLFMAPLRAVIEIGKTVKEEADKEWFDIDHIQRQLVQLEMLYEMDEISEEVYRQKEEILIQRYDVAKQRELDEWNARGGLRRDNGGDSSWS